MKATLSLMSLSTTSYGLSYFLFEAIFAIIGSVLLTWPFIGSVHIFGVETYEEAYSKGLQLMICIMLFNVSQVPFTMSLSTFFSDSSLGNNLGGLILYASMLLPIYLLQQPHLRTLLYLLCPVFPICSWIIVMCSIIDNHSLEPAFPLLMSTMGINIRFAWLSLTLACPLHLLMYTYLDQVMPTASFGVRKGCCFCLRRTRTSPEVHEEDNYSRVQDMENSNSLE